MVVSLAAWSLVVEPGKKVTHEVFRDIKITNAALGAKLEDEKGRTTLKIFYTPPPTSDDEDEEDEGDNKKKSPKKKEKETIKEVALCSLIPSSIEQATLDITFVEDDIVQFEVVGKNAIHLFGNYIDQDPMADMPPEDDYDDDESVNLLDVSSDVEIDPAELDGLDDSDDDENRFEEIPDDEPVAGKKRGRDEDDAMDADVSMTEQATKKLKDESGSPADAKSKKDKKRNKKKAQGEAEKAANGQAASSSPEKPAEKGKNTGASQETKELAGGLKIKDVKTGSGKEAKAGNTILMRYIGKLQGGKVFDSNTKGKPFTFHLGKGEVIKGWDQGVAGMKVGGERLIIVPPSLGYGNKKMGDIPPNSTLHFECKLLEIK